MSRPCAWLFVVSALFGATLAGQTREERSTFLGVLHEHPGIQYASRSTTDRVAKLTQALSQGGRVLRRDARTGYLLPVLEALGVAPESQLLVFSKTGVQRDYTSPHNPRAIYFDRSVAVGYVPGAPFIEIASHDPQQGVVFYIVDQTAETPIPVRRTSCLACHVSATTLYVPGMIARSNFVDERGNVMPQLGGTDVDHHTGHPDRWGGWFVTSEDAAPPYSQRGHAGNITFSGREVTSNDVFVQWMGSAPETRGYLSPSSDIVSLLVFDHQMRAINLLTRLNWEARVDAGSDTVKGLERELADYLLFAGEMPPSAPLRPRPAFAERLASATPADRQGRSCGELDLVNRLFRYPCSYMIYSEAFDGLPAPVKQAVYRRMIDVLTADAPVRSARRADPDRAAVLGILRDTKADFPR